MLQRRNSIARCSAIVFIAGLSTSTATFAAASPSGQWTRDDGSERARISRCGTKICATTTWVKNPNGMEKPGDKFIMTITAGGPGHWMGSALDPRRNLRYTVDLLMEGDRLTTRGCLSGGAACISADWTRVGN
jgi:uncharacterized protein (DUF2147 family)